MTQKRTLQFNVSERKINRAGKLKILIAARRRGDGNRVERKITFLIEHVGLMRRFSL